MDQAVLYAEILKLDVFSLFKIIIKMTDYRLSKLQYN